MIDRRIQFDDKWVKEDEGVTRLYFIAPKDTLGSQYPDAEHAEICVEFPTERPKANCSVVSVSPTKYFEEEDGYVDYDWSDVDLPDEEIKELIALPDKVFVNTVDGNTLTQPAFVDFVWEEAERQFNDCHDDEKWDELSDDEQREIFYEQYDHQLNDNDWVECASLDERVDAIDAVRRQKDGADIVEPSKDIEER